jgi:hypothetical protein
LANTRWAPILEKWNSSKVRRVVSSPR